MEYGEVSVTCLYDGCTKLITFEYDPGYPNTMWEPGEPATWNAVSDSLVQGSYDFGNHDHDNVPNEKYYAWLDDAKMRADFINAQSWDNYYDY